MIDCDLAKVQSRRLSIKQSGMILYLHTLHYINQGHRLGFIKSNTSDKMTLCQAYPMSDYGRNATVVLQSIEALSILPTCWNSSAQFILQRHSQISSSLMVNTTWQSSHKTTSWKDFFKDSIFIFISSGLYRASVKGHQNIIATPTCCTHITRLAQLWERSLTGWHLINELACKRVKQGNPAGQPTPPINTATKMMASNCLISWGKKVKWVMSSFLRLTPKNSHIV